MLKKVISILCFSFTAVVPVFADTILVEDLLSNLNTGTGQYSSKSKNFESISNVLTADNVVSWLADDTGQYMRWTCLNGKTNYSVAPTLTSLGNSEYTLQITNRSANAGSVAGFSYTLNDAAINNNYTTSFNLTYTFDYSVCASSVSGVLSVVYKTEEGWQISYSSFTTGTDSLATISVTDVALTDTSVYVVLATTTGAGNITYGALSATATIATIPEPSSFCLFGTLAMLAVISLRRRRRNIK